MKKVLEADQVITFEPVLPKEMKRLFEKAANIGGFNSVWDFIISSATAKAEAMVESDPGNEAIKRLKMTEDPNFFTSEADRKHFFDTLMNPPEPNEALKAAFKKYKAAGNV
ncbi:MAG: DUF1778 domain-containing protein [Bacteroidota bacterium]